MRNAENRLFEGGHYQLNFDSANGALFTGVFANTVKFVTE
jgi:sorbitol-specific phosphotransferase system component IIA